MRKALLGGFSYLKVEVFTLMQPFSYFIEASSSKETNKPIHINTKKKEPILYDYFLGTFYRNFDCNNKAIQVF